MKKQFIKLIVVLVGVVTLIFVGCKNEEEKPVKPIKPIEGKLLKQMEEAYPNAKRKATTIKVGGVDIDCDEVEGNYIYQGDMLLKPDGQKRFAKRLAIDIPEYRWTNNTFVYEIDKAYPYVDRIEKAIKLYEGTTIKFKKRTNEKNYVLFTYVKNGGCSSFVGMIGGVQKIKLGDGCTFGNIAHEIGHALGLKHEQSRPDRDKYIKVNLENIKKGKERNFKVVPEVFNPVTIGAFDFESIMLYHSWSFTIANDRSKPTLVKLDGTKFGNQRERLSEGDKEILTYLYPKLNGLSLEKEEISIENGEKITLNITSGNGDYEVTSSDNSIVEVSEKNGVLTFETKQAGTVTVKVKDTKTGETKEIKVTVEKQSYIELTTALAVKDTIKLGFDAKPEYRANVWIDLNNNKVKDDGETVTKFGERDRWGKLICNLYILGSQTFRVYGKVSLLKTDNERHRGNVYTGQKITDLDISNNLYLNSLDCSFNELTSIDVSQNSNLESLSCYRNQLTSIDVSRNINLNSLDCGGNQLTSIDVSQNSNLISLSCYRNQLTSIDVSQNHNLKKLNCGMNQISNIDVLQNSNLVSLGCGANQLRSIDVSQNIKLESLSCYENQISSIDVSQNSNLISLSCGKNQLSNLDVSQNTQLSDLYLHESELTSIDVSNNLQLKYLHCPYSKLTSIDVSKNINLEYLNISRTQLKTVDVSKNTKLETLRCHESPLFSSLDLSKCPKLKLLFAWRSPNLTCIKVSQELLDKEGVTWNIDERTQTLSLTCQ